MEITRNMVLEAMVQHETLTLGALEEKESRGLRPDREQLQHLLSELVDDNCLTLLNGVTPETYTITDKGINDGKKLPDADAVKIAHSFGYGDR